jgi:hypothetical protein
MANLSYKWGMILAYLAVLGFFVLLIMESTK